MAKSMKLGGGGRFQKLARKVGKRLAAWIGREKYGKGRFQKMAAKGRKRAAMARKKTAVNKK